MVIGNEGEPTNEKCPKCNGKIVYNGNYFCENWGDTCNWALPHPQIEMADKKISYSLVGYWEEEGPTGEYLQYP
jgi:hypothetical protein